MKFIFLPAIFLIQICSAQTAGDVISKVRAAQLSLKDISYELRRVDTFTNGTVWDHSGSCQIRVEPSDKAIGFYFWGKRNDMEQETIYDGKIAYAIDHAKKSYYFYTGIESIPHIFGAVGGQMVFGDLVRLDTSGAKSFELSENADHYLLRLNYPDNKEYDVTDRYKLVFIDKKTFLPDEEINHFLVLNKVQHQHLQLKNLRINQKPADYLFEKKDFLASYDQEVQKPGRRLQALLGKPLPYFDLTSFNGEKITTEDLKGKAVLLDFWAVWCGPCMASMPKVEGLYKKYKDKGLMVLGMMIEETDAEPARLWAKKASDQFSHADRQRKAQGGFSGQRRALIPTY